jgi:ribonucleoside-triphosphate reductase (thioredoxin)
MSATIDLSEFVYMRTYSRWISELGRREKWEETVSRFVEWITRDVDNLPESLKDEMYSMIHSKNVMPSMRALWSAGASADRENIGIYNCSFLPIDCIRAFSEGLYILMQGTGVGYSVESTFVDNLPVVCKTTKHIESIVVDDSSIGWAEAFDKVLMSLWKGNDVEIDVSKVRARNAVLRTKGGRASGPQPLLDAVEFATQMLSDARGRKITCIEAHDLMCKIASIVVVGGVRRAAMISFSDPSDESLRHAKNWKLDSFPNIRYMANNSAYYSERPSEEVFWDEWKALAESGSGERGFSIDNWWRRADRPKGMTRSNPCHEIGLRYTPSTNPWTGEGGSGQFCNLSAAVMRSDDTIDSMKEKIRLATWIGCLQASHTNFGYLREGWSELCKEDRLLGVDITGQCDNPTLSMDWEIMAEFNKIALETARLASEALNINYPAAITCGKPSGNSSQFVDCASGFHPRYSKYYLRHVRVSAGDPICDMMKAQGFPLYKENGQENLSDDEVNTWVAQFPVKAPEGCMTREDEDSIQQMERYLGIMRSWCSEKGHNQSATIYVKDNDWQKVGQWVWDHFDEIVGLSFLPYDGGKYRLAPYVEISESEYEDAMSKWNSVDFSKLVDFEEDDMGEGSQDYACTSGGCEV